MSTCYDKYSGCENSTCYGEISQCIAQCPIETQELPPATAPANPTTGGAGAPTEQTPQECNETKCLPAYKSCQMMDNMTPVQCSDDYQKCTVECGLLF